MDAPRLGHDSPLPAVLLVEAAVGYLTGAQRTKPIATWRDTALEWGRHRGPRRGAGTAAHLAPVSTGVAGYKVADYLDQHGRRTRQGLSSLKERGRVKGGFAGLWLSAGVRDWRLLFPW